MKRVTDGPTNFGRAQSLCIRARITSAMVVTILRDSRHFTAPHVIDHYRHGTARQQRIYRDALKNGSLVYFLKTHGYDVHAVLGPDAPKEST